MKNKKIEDTIKNILPNNDRSKLINCSGDDFFKNKKVTYKQVCKFTEKFDNQCSDSWLTDILNNEVDIKKLINVIQNLNKHDNINFIFKK